MSGKRDEQRQHVLRSIALLERQHGRPTTPGELAAKLGITKQAVARRLQHLRDDGLVQPSHGRYAPILLTSRGRQESGLPEGVPVIGSIAAGQPILAEHNVQREIDSLRELLGLRDGDFFLTVRGDSMTGEGIHDGDLVAVHATTQVHDGEIAVVTVPGENTGTLKRLYRQGDRVLLRSANPAYPLMEFNARDVQIQGRYAGHVALHRARRSLHQT